MPLHKETSNRPPASKIPVPAKGHPQSKGTTNSQAAKAKASKHEEDPQTELEKLDFLRSKLEQSMTVFIKARKELQEVLSAGGSSEQGRPLTESAVELKSELQRHRDLTSRVQPLLKENREPRKLIQDGTHTANSYEFLKSIMD